MTWCREDASSAKSRNKSSLVLNKCLLSTYCVSGGVKGTGDTAINRAVLAPRCFSSFLKNVLINLTVLSLSCVTQDLYLQHVNP